MRRYAVITNSDARTVSSYIPANYSVAIVCDDCLVISGEDIAGWTLTGYVIPRLASGLISAIEIRSEDAIQIAEKGFAGYVSAS